MCFSREQVNTQFNVLKDQRNHSNLESGEKDKFKISTYKNSLYKTSGDIFSQFFNSFILKSNREEQT